MTSQWVEIPFRCCQMCHKKRGYQYKIIENGIWWIDIEDDQYPYVTYYYCIPCYTVLHHLYSHKTKLIYNYFDLKFVETDFIDTRDQLFYNVIVNPLKYNQFVDCHRELYLKPRWVCLYYFFKLNQNTIPMDIFNYTVKNYYFQI